MKHIILLSLTFVLTAVVSSCEKEDFDHENSYERSYQIWLNFKKESDNSYTYTTESGSWTGFSTQTKITVENGTVIGREFKYTQIGRYGIPEGGWDEATVIEAFKSKGYPDDHIEKLFEGDILSSLQWKEGQEELGSHSSGSNIWTLDEVYKYAKDNWLIKRKNASSYFEAKNNGMISSCGYIEDGCQDDCFVGIGITSIEKRP